MEAHLKEIKREYGKLFADVSDALFQADPIGINFGGNTNEYDPEAGTIIPRLKTANSAQDVQSIVYGEFKKWFGASIVCKKEQYQPISVKILELWCEFKH